MPTSGTMRLPSLTTTKRGRAQVPPPISAHMRYLSSAERPTILPVMRYLLSECPVEERRHLAAGDDTVGAVLVVGRWVASFGDSGGSELVDVVFEDRVIVVDK